MTWTDRLAVIAEELTREAKRRRQRAMRYAQGLDFVEHEGRARVYPRQATELPEEVRSKKPFATITFYPRKRWGLLDLFGHTVIVHFGYDPALDVVADTDKERRSKRRHMRHLLRRVQREGNLSSQTICIDAQTSPRLIMEEFAVIMAQKGISDSSAEKLLGFHTRDDVARTTASQLVRNFVDPVYPQSYAAYKNAIRLRVAGPEEMGQDVPTQHEPIEQEMPDEVRRKMQAPKYRPQPADYSVHQAARILGVSKRTLYDQVSKGKLPTHKDKWGRVRILAGALEELRQEREKEEQMQGLARVVADRYDIQTASARKRIRRALERGKTIKEVYLEAEAYQAVGKQSGKDVTGERLMAACPSEPWQRELTVRS